MTGVATGMIERATETEDVNHRDPGNLVALEAVAAQDRKLRLRLV